MALVGQAIIVGGALLIYLASPNQPLDAGRRTRPRLGWAGSAILVAGLVVLLGKLDPATATFVAMTIVMLVWSVLATAIGWWRRPRSKRP